MRTLVAFLMLGVLACGRSEARPPRTADLRIVVDDTPRTMEEVTRSVERNGGYLTHSDMWREGDVVRAKLTLRVPPERLTATLATIRATAKRIDHECVH